MSEDYEKSSAPGLLDLPSLPSFAGLQFDRSSGRIALAPRYQQHMTTMFDAMPPPLTDAAISRTPYVLHEADVPTYSKYGPDRPGWHYYTSGPHQICPPELNCSPSEMASVFLRHVVPEQNSRIWNGDRSFVYFPHTPIRAGEVVTTTSGDGLSARNATLPGHVFYDGEITRRIERDPDGGWSARTDGYGNNVIPYFDRANEYFGPGIFDRLDSQLRDDFLQSRSRRPFMAGAAPFGFQKTPFDSSSIK